MRLRYAESLAVVEWHPYAFDTLNINPDDSLRVARYQHNRGQPALILDGYLEVAIPDDPVQYYGAFDAAISSVKSDTSFMMLEVSGKADSATGHVFIRLAADSVVPGSSPMLYCVVTADSLIDLLGAAYYRVPVQFLPDRNGRPVSIARGDTLVDTLTFATTGQRIDKLGAVVFVEDASGTEEHRVLQAATIKSFEITEEK